MPFAAALLLAGAATAVAQQPTQAQQDAIKSSCRADFQSQCASVSPGGKAAFECLQSHQSSLSAACQSAVGAVAAPQANAPSAPSGGTAAAAPRPAMSPRQELAIVRQACGPDYRRLCRGVPLGGGRAVGCLADHHASLSRICQRTLDQAQSQR